MTAEALSLSGQAFLACNGQDATGQPLPAEGFSGYFFQGADFVAGQAGFAAFRAAGGTPPLSEDGCYVHHHRAGEAHVFTTDHCGYHKLFYIHRPGFWAVSNSLWQIARSLWQAGLTPEPNLAEIAAMEAEGTLIPTGRGMFFGQLSTFDSLIRGVQLAPHGMALHVSATGASLHPLPPRSGQTPRPADYAQSLARALGVWQARIAGLAAAGLHLSADLTGGLDSRTVLALLMSGAPGPALSLRSNLNDRGARDLRLAQSLAAHLGLPHNDPKAPKPPAIPALRAFETWRDLSLGAYHPIYFPQSLPTAQILHFGGGGGGNQRSVYDRSLWARLTGAGRLERFIPARMRNLRPPAQRAAYGQALRATMARLVAQQEDVTQQGSSQIAPLVLHYRAFRNRFHAGRTPQYILSVNPLASTLFDDCAALAGADRIARAQMFYDIMESLHPGLTALPFDSRRKSPDAAITAGLTRVTPLPHPPGRVFVPAPLPKRRKAPPAPPGTAFDHLARLYAKARPLAAAHLAPAYLRRADHALARAVAQRRFAHPNRSKRVGVVCAFALFLPPDPDATPTKD